MILLLCSVFDAKVGAYSPPMAFKTKGEAIRSFGDACKDEKVPFRSHPEDYRIVLLGSFDDNSGVLSSCVAEPLIGASELGEL